MSTLLHAFPVAHGRDECLSRVLVASDGRGPSEVALLAARQLAPLGTLTVLSVWPDEELSKKYSPMIQVQIDRVFGEPADVCPVVRIGYPPAALASYADAHAKSLLIVGIGRERVSDRLLGDESALRLARLTRTPMFAVAPDCVVPARRVVVAVDFTLTSMHAARLALHLAAPDADVVAAYVARPDDVLNREAALGRAARALQTGFCGRVTPRVLRGDPATELLALSRDWVADLISIGLHGTGPGDRVDIGNVATRVVRCANCSVIATPRELAT